MMQFKITWTSGKTVTEYNSDCSTVAEFVNVKFGRGFDIDAYGIKVVVVDDEAVPESVVETPKVKVTKPKKVKVADE